LWLREGHKFRFAADLGGPQAYHDHMFAEPIVTSDPRSAIGQVAESGEVLQIDVISKAPTHGMKIRVSTIEIANGRTLIAVPMLNGQEVVDIITPTFALRSTNLAGVPVSPNDDFQISGTLAPMPTFPCACPLPLIGSAANSHWFRARGLLSSGN
jgi:hypothetical protein